ncbi:IL-6 subfamily cytokine M17 [Eucyclogobius newberryi]|uniref:IL-6 subfamily cytokine M17 n=1 Tax=Eucyclogobius newberryi TaxID=166745 RepID=UPI003B5BFC9C
MTKSGQMACGTARRMNGHVKSMYFQLYTKTAATLLSLMLMMVFDTTIMVAASRTQQCGNSLLQALKLARLVQKESVDIIRTYKAAQGDLSELICKVTLYGLPDPNISGLEPSEQISSIHTSLQEFSPHFRRVYDQQTDLQLADSLLLLQLNLIRGRSQYLDVQINHVYQDLFPNSPPLVPDSSGGATSLPPPQNVFQQKVYGCVVLKTYKEFLSNVCKYLRTLKNQMCGMNIRRVNKTFF